MGGFLGKHSNHLPSRPRSTRSGFRAVPWGWSGANRHCGGQPRCSKSTPKTLTHVLMTWHRHMEPPHIKLRGYCTWGQNYNAHAHAHRSPTKTIPFFRTENVTKPSIVFVYLRSRLMLGDLLLPCSSDSDSTSVPVCVRRSCSTAIAADCRSHTK